jgi:hypothetical protein
MCFTFVKSITNYLFSYWCLLGMRRILLSVGVASAAAFVLGTAGSALHQGNAGPTSFVILNAGGDPGVPAWKVVHSASLCIVHHLVFLWMICYIS